MTYFYLVSLQRFDSPKFDARVICKTYEDADKWVHKQSCLYGYDIQLIEGVGFE